MDTPEIGEKRADDATERLRALAGVTVRVEQGPRTIDPFGRRLAYVNTEFCVSMDALLVKEALAVAWTRDSQHKDYLMILE